RVGRAGWSRRSTRARSTATRSTSASAVVAGSPAGGWRTARSADIGHLHVVGIGRGVAGGDGAADAGAGVLLPQALPQERTPQLGLLLGLPDAAAQLLGADLGEGGCHWRSSGQDGLPVPRIKGCERGYKTDKPDSPVCPVCPSTCPVAFWLAPP